MAHDENKGKKPKDNVDSGTPSVISEALDGIKKGKYGSVTKDIAALVARRNEVLYAKYPTLANQNLKVATSHDEETPTLENQQITSLAHKHVIDLEEEHSVKDTPASPSNIVIIDDSDEEDDTQEKNFIPSHHQVVLPGTVENDAPASPKYNVMDSDTEETPTLENQQITSFAHKDVIALEEERNVKDTPASPSNVGIIDSGEEDDTDKKSFIPSHHQVVLPGTVENDAPAAPSNNNAMDSDDTDKIAPSPAIMMIVVSDRTKYPGFTTRRRSKRTRPNKATEAGIDIVGKDKGKGVYVGVQEEEEEDNQDNTEDADLEDIWREMSMGIEYSKDVSADPLPDEEAEEDKDCDHSFIFKDDIGSVCRVCGLVAQGIETMFEFQFNQGKKNRRTYYNDDSRNKKEKGVFGIHIPEDDLRVTEVFPHPRHRKEMKPHQVEGFNFLVRNLVGDNPGGCILAHAPGSGKTFMLISFIQSFLGKYPTARPLVVLPKGIVSTWKKEFRIWQVEDIPLYDFYSEKANKRSQQLEVLEKWMKEKSILFLGYKQFTTIVCDHGTDDISSSCQKILLNVPTILILDEGHNPRNENTDMVQSLAKVQTPRKVVLSGTLFQNRVKEVFNILDLVRPKFLKMETSRPIVKRIHSRVHIPGVRNFYDLVENILQDDDIDFRTKVAVIRDLREMTSSVLHYYKGDSLDELPGIVDFTVLLNLTSRQKLEIDKLKESSTKFKMTSDASAVYLHPKMKPTISDHEMDKLIDKVDLEGVKSKFFRVMLDLCGSAGEKLLVFSQYLPPLRYLERLVMRWKGWSLGKEFFVITGDISTEQREEWVEKFNSSPDAKVFFGSIKACGEGISLVGASRVIIMDVHLNPSVTRQAIGRAFRPGQKKIVYVYRLVAADSPEEEDHVTCDRKELISKMWFEWDEYSGDRPFEVEAVDVEECGDPFFESPLLRKDVKSLYKR